MKNTRKYLLLILFLLTCSCVSSKTKGIANMENPSKNLELISGYADYQNNKIYIKQKIYGKNYIISGDAKNLLNPEYIDTRILGERLITLNEIREEKEGEEEFLQNPKIKKLNIISKKEFEKATGGIIEEALFELVPKEKNQAIVVAIKDKEIILYRDRKNKIKSKPINKKPDKVKIVEYYTDEVYKKEVFKKLSKNLKIKKKIKDDIILFEYQDDIFDYSIGVLNFKDYETYPFDYSELYQIKEGGSKLAYTGNFFGSVVLKSHVYTVLKNPFTSAYKVITITWYTGKKFFQDKGFVSNDVIPPLNNKGEMMDIAKFDKLLDDKVSKEVYKAKVDFFIGGDEFFPDFIKSIENAQDYINLRVYIFDNDDYAVQIADLLKKKSLNGGEEFKIKILKDSLANITAGAKQSEISSSDIDFKSPGNMKKYLRKDSRIKIKTTANFFLTFDHTKSFIFDDKITYVGGMNIGKEYRYSWHDMMAKLEGPITKPIKKEFDKTWVATGISGDFGLFAVKIGGKKEEKKPVITDDMIDVRLLYTKSGNRGIYKAQMNAIKKAKKFIYVENPYLSDKRIVKALIKARQRGVDVRVILPARNNVGIMHSNNMAITNLFIKNGVRVYHYPTMTHVKASIYDGWGCVGSANFDRLSFDRNMELNIGFSDKKVVADLKKRLFEKDFTISKEIVEPVPVFWKDNRMRTVANYL